MAVRGRTLIDGAGTPPPPVPASMLGHRLSAIGYRSSMLFRVLADVLVGIHFLFVVFVVTGGFLAWRWPRLAWVHVPVAVWGALIEFAGWICPLTPLENDLRRAAGQAGYAGGFIEHYVIPIVYPSGLTRGVQLVLGIAVVVVNLVAYGRVLWRRRRMADRR